MESASVSSLAKASPGIGRKSRVFLAALIVVAAIAYLMYSGFSGGAVTYYEIEQLLDQADSLRGTEVKVSGKIVGESIDWDPARIRLAFVIRGESGRDLQVVYNRSKPDVFGDGLETVVQGVLDQNGVFQADEVLTRCPSKYEPANTAES